MVCCTGLDWTEDKRVRTVRGTSNCRGEEEEEEEQEEQEEEEKGGWRMEGGGREEGGGRREEELKKPLFLNILIKMPVIWPTCTWDLQL